MADPDSKEAQPRRPYRLEEQVGFLLRLANQRHVAIFQSLAPEGLTPMQFSALIRTAELGQCSQNRLGRLTGMDVATIKGVVDRLRAKGLVRLSPDPADRRRTLISLSEKSKSMIPVLQAAGHVVSEETLAPLAPDERKLFIELLRKLA